MDNPKADFFRPKISTFRYYKSEKSGKVIKKLKHVYKTKAFKYIQRFSCNKGKQKRNNIQEQVFKINSKMRQIKRS